MTPLEELQAAHKRLSELRHGATPGPWTAVDDDDFEEIDIHGEPPFNVGSVWTGHTADLIVTLHRTIDAQLRLLSDAQFLVQQGFGQQSVLALARAINGGAE